MSILPKKGAFRVLPGLVVEFWSLVSEPGKMGFQLIEISRFVGLPIVRFRKHTFEKTAIQIEIVKA